MKNNEIIKIKLPLTFYGELELRACVKAMKEEEKKGRKILFYREKSGQVDE